MSCYEMKWSSSSLNHRLYVILSLELQPNVVDLDINDNMSFTTVHNFCKKCIVQIPICFFQSHTHLSHIKWQSGLYFFHPEFFKFSHSSDLSGQDNHIITIGIQPSCFGQTAHSQCSPEEVSSGFKLAFSEWFMNNKSFMVPVAQ